MACVKTLRGRGSDEREATAPRNSREASVLRTTEKEGCSIDQGKARKKKHNKKPSRTQTWKEKEAVKLRVSQVSENLSKPRRITK